MRIWWVVIIGMLASGQAALAAELSELRGPAADSIRSYLNKQKVDCASDPDKKCSLASQIIEAKLFYGRFPGEATKTAVLFLSEDTGGSGAALEVMAWEAKPHAPFELVGKTDDAIGGNARDIGFKAGHIIEYTGTVMLSGDVHASPSGKRVFELRLDGDRLYFRGPK